MSMFVKDHYVFRLSSTGTEGGRHAQKVAADNSTAPRRGAHPTARERITQRMKTVIIFQTVANLKWDDRESNPDALSSGKFSHHYSFRYRNARACVS
jgi:hypothetical protein